MKGIIRKADIVLAAVLLMFCAALAYMSAAQGSAGTEVRVDADGQLYGVYSLDENQIIDIDSEKGHNQIKIEDGKVLMTEADCPDGYCLNQHKASGGISSSKQTIVCLPNKVVISLKGDEQSDIEEDDDVPDAVAGSPAGGSNGQ